MAEDIGSQNKGYFIVFTLLHFFFLIDYFIF